MIVLTEGFSLVKSQEKILDCTTSLLKEDEQYSLLMNNEPIIGFNFGKEEIFLRLAMAELSHKLTSSIEALHDISDVEIITHPQNRLFFLKAVRCQHIRPKGLLKGQVCNKLIFNSYSMNRLGGRIYCPRCQNILYI